MSLYLSVDFYKHAAQTTDGTGKRVPEVTDALNQLGRKLDAVRFTDEAFAQKQVAAQPAAAARQTLPLKLSHWRIKSCMAAPSKGSGWFYEGGSKTYEGQTASRTATVIDNQILQGQSTAEGWFL